MVSELSVNGTVVKHI